MPEWSVSREVVGAGPSPRATKPDVENSILSLRVPPHICTPSNCAHSHTHTCNSEQSGGNEDWDLEGGRKARFSTV